jgi:hypothetical protein
MKLPGKHYDMKLQCPRCGWGFDLGLRLIGEVKDGTPGDEARGFTVCSKCLCAMDFRVDGSDVRELTPEIIAKLPVESMLAILKVQYMAWVANAIETGETRH